MSHGFLQAYIHTYVHTSFLVRSTPLPQGRAGMIFSQANKYVWGGGGGGAKE